MSEDDDDALIVLAHAVEPGDHLLGRLIADLGPAQALSAVRDGRSGLSSEAGLQARVDGVTAARARDRAAACDARIITRFDPEWPTQLDLLGAQVPVALWVRGAANLRLLALRSCAVVGARACSAYGEEVAYAWSAGLVENGWQVVSGAAFGIDAAAHRGALAAGGATLALVAGGVDVPYPRAHTALLERIVDDGLVISETPVGEPVRRQRFLSRNRLIAALARATVVVEAAERSGSRVTARAAAALRRPVAAVPGPVTSAASAGCHRMIQEGEAVLVADLPDLLALLDLDAVSTSPGQAGSAPAEDHRVERDRLGSRERRVLDAIPARTVIDLGALVRAAGLGPTDVLAATGLLVAGGLLREEAAGWRLAPSARPRA